MTRWIILAVVSVSAAFWVVGYQLAESATKIQVNTSDPQNISNKSFDTTNTFSGTISAPTLIANSIPLLNGSKILASTSNPTNGQLLIGSTGAIPVLGTIAGTANRVTVTMGPGSITLSGPQDLHSGATPTFNGMRMPYNTYMFARNAADTADVGLIKLGVSGFIELGDTLKNPTLHADPTAGKQCATKDYVDGLPQSSGFTTGDVKTTIKTVADTGWVIMADGTIGNAASGATARANSDTSALFALMWTNCIDANCPVSSGRGASAAADFAANKTIALPKALGRALASSGSGSGLSARTLGQSLGSENAIVVSHSHTITDPGHDHSYTSPNAVVNNSAGGAQPLVQATSASTTGSSTTGITINSAGSSGTGANMQPTMFLTVMIKL